MGVISLVQSSRPRKLQANPRKTSIDQLFVCVVDVTVLHIHTVRSSGLEETLVVPAMQRALRQLQREETSMFQDATLVACVLSLVSCAWLVWRISCNGCLLSRQLWHLALSDMFECSVVLLANLPIASLIGTRGIWLLGAWFFVSSLLFECHVAAGFAAVFWRWRRLSCHL